MLLQIHADGRLGLIVIVHLLLFLHALRFLLRIVHLRELTLLRGSVFPASVTSAFLLTTCRGRRLLLAVAASALDSSDSVVSLDLVQLRAPAC